LHNKPQGCGASVASAAGPFSTKNKTHQVKWCYIPEDNRLIPASV
jgi:hypothetical protein